jgi:hypothetical protein
MLDCGHANNVAMANRYPALQSWQFERGRPFSFRPSFPADLKI